MIVNKLHEELHGRGLLELGHENPAMNEALCESFRTLMTPSTQKLLIMVRKFVMTVQLKMLRLMMQPSS
jgi:hypothetical protein